MKLQQAEGFGMDVLFDMLDGLEQQTRPLMEAGGWRAAPPLRSCAHTFMPRMPPP
jgi:hypothetical protein